MARKISIPQHSSLGVVWSVGWLFTVGYLGMGFWQGVWAFFAWPYFLGVHFAAI